MLEIHDPHGKIDVPIPKRCLTTPTVEWSHKTNKNPNMNVCTKYVPSNSSHSKY